ncbi:pyridoxamine 5'-phosphate oxidase family protein [Streptosporangium roseum]|uniref:pyridoxamine 5'-phosphate oxidase family protein n=1 Tax=Streptosporangium roseum TaxID=2001 RepID=UPI0007C6668C|nr:pyridoxamine 5'-phosphate oxidase family protein [Streptosporangium roseum]
MRAKDTTSSEDGGRAEILDRDTCMALLETAGIGRIAWSAPNGEVVVLPVNFVVDRDSIVFKTSQGGKLDAVHRGRPLSFEADGMEPALRVGWSVLLVGVGEVVADPDQVRRLRELPAPWAAMAEPVFIRLTARQVTGRRLPLHPGGVAVERVGDT